MKLKYLFTAEYLDGSTYKQNFVDASVKFPPIKDEHGQLQGRSCMADIQEDIDTYKIKRFSLVENKLIGGHIYTVDLTDGHFEVDGVPFKGQGERKLPVPFAKYKLIFFRDRSDSFTTPAVYYKPQAVTKYEKGMTVINSNGETHTFPRVDKTWTQLDEIILEGKQQTVERTYVLPTPPVPTLEYVLGWQTTIARKNYQQKIVIQ